MWNIYRCTYVLHNIKVNLKYLKEELFLNQSIIIGNKPYRQNSLYNFKDKKCCQKLNINATADASGYKFDQFEAINRYVKNFETASVGISALLYKII